MIASRGLGAIELLRGVLPPGAIEAFWVLTWLGSVAVVTALVVAVYWFEARERGAWALGALLAAYALTLALKAAFGLPRPPATGWRIAVDSPGFPSGHAIAATVGWGALALAVDRGPRRRRYGIAAAVVGLVAASRVVLGVHYLVDVVAGVAVGAALLWVAVRLDAPTRTLGLAVGLAAVAVPLTGGGPDALALLGVTLGGFLVWTRAPVPTDPLARGLPAVAGIVAVGVVGFAVHRIAPDGPLALLTGAAAGAVIVGLPLLVQRIR